jgi:hypothetical protein
MPRHTLMCSIAPSARLEVAKLAGPIDLTAVVDHGKTFVVEEGNVGQGMGMEEAKWVADPCCQASTGGQQRMVGTILKWCVFKVAIPRTYVSSEDCSCHLTSEAIQVQWEPLVKGSQEHVHIATEASS